MMLYKDVKLDIQLSEPGVYMMGSDGAIGKTYTKVLMCSYNATHPGTFNVITYQKGFTTGDYLKLLYNFDAKIVFMDRANLYMNDFIIQYINSNPKIYLVDIKDSDFWNNVSTRFCTIQRFPNMTVIKEL